MESPIRHRAVSSAVSDGSKCASSGSRSPQLGVVEVWFLQLGETRDSIAVDQIRPRPPLAMFYIDGQKIEGQPSRAP